MPVSATRTIIATDGTLRPELGRNTQSYLVRVTGEAHLNQVAIPHDLGFDPTWVQIQAVYTQGGGPGNGLQGSLVPECNNAGTALVYVANTSITARVYSLGGALTTPVIDVLVHCGRTHATPL